MADHTKIEWADATVNAINGCSLASPGCTNCYAMRLAGTRMKSHPSRAGLTQDSKAGPVWTGEVRLNEKALLDPLKWKRPRRIFWNAHGDMFHPSVPDAWIDRCFSVMARTVSVQEPDHVNRVGRRVKGYSRVGHIHMVLTKRSERMREYISRFKKDSHGYYTRDGIDYPQREAGSPLFHQWPLPNVWLGVSVEDQVRADERIPDLLATPAAVRFISAEPLLGPVRLDHVKFVDEPTFTAWESALNGKPFTVAGLGNRMRKWCDEAGLAHCSLHGLRKATSRRIAESGGTDAEGMAITGHRKAETFTHYRAAANRTVLADAAFSNVVSTFDKGEK